MAIEEETKTMDEVFTDAEAAPSKDLVEDDLECVNSNTKIEDSRKTRSGDWSKDRKESIKCIMREKKLQQRIGLGQNIYSILIVSSTRSWPFVFCMGVYAIKISILAILLSDIDFTLLESEEIKVTAVKFCLIPVAVAMQEDMIYSFYFYANVIYCPSILKHSKFATKNRFYFSYFLRTIDGLMSLFCNYFIMLITTRTLDVFLNFAALQFLYVIDDVFYDLIAQGFFGDVLAGYSDICNSVTMERRLSKDDTRLFGFLRISWLDTTLFIVSLLICYAILAVVTVAKYDDDFNAITGTETPSMMPSGFDFMGNMTDDLDVAM